MVQCVLKNSYGEYYGDSCVVTDIQDATLFDSYEEAYKTYDDFCDLGIDMYDCEGHRLWDPVIVKKDEDGFWEEVE